MNRRQHQLRRTAVIVLALIVINLAIAGARGWAPDLWWQGPASIVVMTIVLARVWAPHGQFDSARVKEKPSG
jgi:hypothetical protein